MDPPALPPIATRGLAAARVKRAVGGDPGVATATMTAAMATIPLALVANGATLARCAVASAAAAGDLADSACDSAAEALRLVTPATGGLRVQERDTLP